MFLFMFILIKSFQLFTLVQYYVLIRYYYYIPFYYFFFKYKYLKVILTVISIFTYVNKKK